ncbi:MAG: Dabb family protein [Acidimicrobiales bacterium]
MTVRHIVLFRFREGTTEEQIARLSSGLSALPEAIGQIRAYRHGPDAGITDTAWDYAVIGDFDSAEDYLVYRNHPVHQELIRDLVEPIADARAAIQLLVD